MDLVEFPEKYENIMRLAQQALAKQENHKAEQLLKRAQALVPSFECNSVLVFCLFKLDKKQEALQHALDYETDYLKQEVFAAFYFELLLQTQNYLYARKLIAMNNFSEHFEQELVEKMKYMEYFSQQIKDQKQTVAHQQLVDFAEKSPVEQLRLFSVIQQLSYEELLQYAEQFLTRKAVHPLVRAKLFELLVQLKVEQPVSVLTLENEKVTLIPKKQILPEYQNSYLYLVKRVEEYEQEDALLAMNLKEEFTLQSALTYPFFDQYIEDSEWWFRKTVSYYQELVIGKERREETGFAKKRAELLRQSFDFL